MRKRDLHPDVAIAHLDGADRPRVKGAAAFEIEAGMMPMTGQDAVIDAAAIEREAHVWATIVEGKDAPSVVNDEDRTMAAVHDEPAFRLQLVKPPRKPELL